MIDTPECPHCHSGLVNRHGKAGTMQRYRCKNCMKTFNAVTNTPLARLQHKEKWLVLFKMHDKWQGTEGVSR